MIAEIELGVGENGVADGDRTHDHRNHNPVLYRLSYSHHLTRCTTESTPAAELVRPAGFEPATHGLEGRCSIQLSYGRFHPMGTVDRLDLTPLESGRGRRIRTSDILVPNQARYRTALYPEVKNRSVTGGAHHTCEVFTRQSKNTAIYRVKSLFCIAN
jgi:hypothetical protein